MASGVGDTRPAPFVPADCDLRDLPAFMLARGIATSTLAMESTGDEFKAAIILYEATYDQVPAGSLPKEDRALAFLSRAGTKWNKVKGVALRGWIECNDGRLYHRITAEKVLIAWISRLKQRLAAKKGGAAKNKTGGFDPRPIWAQINVALDCLERVAPDCRELSKWRRESATGSANGSATGSAGGSADGTGEIIPLGAARA